MENKRRKTLIMVSALFVLTVTSAILIHSAQPLSLIGRASGEINPYSITLSKENAVSYSSSANATYSSHYDNTASFKTSQGNGITVSVSNSTTSINSSSNLGNLYAQSSLSVNSEYATAGKSFQKINSITITSVSTAARTVRFYFNGSDSYESISVPARSSATFDATTLAYNVRSLVITGSSASEFSTIAVASIEINYSCSSDYSDHVVLSSLSVDASGAKTEYTPGETFSSEGIIVRAIYSDFSQLVVSPTSISSPDMSSVGEKIITVTYTEAGITKTADYTITISEAPSGLSGTYVGTYTSIEFISTTTGAYIYGNERLYFTYTISGSKITFTYSSGDNTNFGSYRLFAGGSSPTANSTGSILSGTQISVKTYNMFDTATSRTFTK